jgi:predicted nucleotidyltransferase
VDASASICGLYVGSVHVAPDATPGLLRLAQMELALSALLGGREVELRTYEDLSPLFRDEVRASAVPCMTPRDDQVQA